MVEAHRAAVGLALAEGVPVRLTVMPSTRVGSAAISAVPDGLCQAEKVSRSEPTSPS